MNIGTPSWLARRETLLGKTYDQQLYDNIKIYSTYSYCGGWDPEDTNSRINRNNGGIFGLDFSQDGSILGAACEKRSVLFLDPISHTVIHCLTDAHSNCVNSVKFLDNRMFVTCSDDHLLSLWDFRNTKYPVRHFRGHSSWVKNVEFIADKSMLVTSGFDGYIYTWDINRHESDHTNEFNRVFYTPGLMRMRLTPDSDKMIISTQWGYLLIIHHLDLDQLGRDLLGFKPNMFWLMMQSGEAFMNSDDHISSFMSDRNRPEIIMDFPPGNDAETITSITPHPLGWGVLSRNTNQDEGSEWTCLHDIQLPPIDIFLDGYEDKFCDKSNDSEGNSLGMDMVPATSHGIISNYNDARLIATQSVYTNSYDNDDLADSSDFESGGQSRSTGGHRLTTITSINGMQTRNRVIRTPSHRTGRPNIIAVHIDDSLNRNPSLNSVDEALVSPSGVFDGLLETDDPFNVDDVVSNDADDFSGNEVADEVEYDDDDMDAETVRFQFDNGPVVVDRYGGRQAHLREGRRLNERRSRLQAARRSRVTDAVRVEVQSSDFNARFSFSRHMSEPRAFFIRSAPRISALSSRRRREQQVADVEAVTSQRLQANGSRTIILLGTSSNSHTAAQSNELEDVQGSSLHCRIPKHFRRLTHFIEEPNVGRGYIKEQCFSPCGRLIASPFAYGIRFLAFDPHCREICDTLDRFEGIVTPRKLYEVRTNVSHSQVVLSAQFSPTLPLLATGCLRGKVCFHQPVL